MSKQLINTGSLANDGTGDSLRSGATKVNANFNEIYTAIGNSSSTLITVSGATTGQVLKWNGSAFVPGNLNALTSALDVNGYNIITSSNGNINLAPNGTGDVNITYGGITANFDGSTGKAIIGGKVEYKNEYTTLGSAPAAASNKGFFFTVNGDSNPKVNINITGSGDVVADLITNYSSIDKLIDVDTTTTAPTNGQVLKWSSTSSKWIPGDDTAGAGGGAQNVFATVSADTGSTTANSLTDTLTITGGANCATTITGDILTINVDTVTFDSVSDTTFTAPAPGNSIVYDPQGGGATAAWINQPSPVIWYTLSVGLNNGSYLIEGPGQAQTDDPTLHLYRGFTYVFVNNAGPNHPFRIQSTQGLNGTEWTLGVSGSKTARQYFTVPHSAPNTLYYQCTVHADMNGTFLIK